MKTWLITLALGVTVLLAGCGQHVQQSLKIRPEDRVGAGGDKTIVVLPFADYSYADDLETAYRRNLFVMENLTDRLTASGYRLPVQEDVFRYLVDRGIIALVNYDERQTSVVEEELEDEWSEAMKSELRRYLELNKRNRRKGVASAPGTHGLTREEVVKIGRHFGGDYILRGRIVQYKERQDPSWAPWKRGVLSFVAGATSRLALGQAASEQYDNLAYMAAGSVYGAYAGDDAHWPWDPGKPDQTILGVSTSSDANIIFWGAVGAGLGHLAHESGRVPQAVVQLRIWVQDAFTGEVVWTNRVDVKVSPETVLADFQYDALFEKATEKAVATLVEDFVSQVD